MGNEILEGSRELLQKLADMGGLESMSVLRQAVRAGMQPVLETARAYAPVGLKRHKVYTGRKVQPGFGASSLRVITTIDREKMTATALLGPRREAFYMTQFVERGTSRAAPHPWLRPAFYSQEDAALRAMIASLQDYFNKKSRS